MAGDYLHMMCVLMCVGSWGLAVVVSRLPYNEITREITEFSCG